MESRGDMAGTRSQHHICTDDGGRGEVCGSLRSRQRRKVCPVLFWVLGKFKLELFYLWCRSKKKAWHSPVLFLDGLRYPMVKTAYIANGFCQVDVKLDDNGDIFKCMMVAGHVGYVERDDVEPDAVSGVVEKNTLQPSPHWFLFIKGEAKKADPSFC